MDKQIAKLNIAHFRELLATERGEKMRQTLLQLLAEEEAKLAALEGGPEKRNRDD